MQRRVIAVLEPQAVAFVARQERERKGSHGSPVRKRTRTDACGSLITSLMRASSRKGERSARLRRRERARGEGGDGRRLEAACAATAGTRRMQQRRRRLRAKRGGG